MAFGLPCNTSALLDVKTDSAYHMGVHRCRLGPSEQAALQRAHGAVRAAGDTAAYAEAAVGRGRRAALEAAAGAGAHAAAEEVQGPPDSVGKADGALAERAADSVALEQAQTLAALAALAPATV